MNMDFIHNELPRANERLTELFQKNLIQLQYNYRRLKEVTLEELMASVTYEKLLEILQMMNDRDKSVFIAYLSGKSQKDIRRENHLTPTTVSQILKEWANAICGYALFNRNDEIEELNRKTEVYLEAKAERNYSKILSRVFFESLMGSGMISEALGNLMINYYSTTFILGSTGKLEEPPVNLTYDQYEELCRVLVDGITADTLEAYRPFITAAYSLTKSPGKRNMTNIKLVIEQAYGKIWRFDSGVEDLFTQDDPDISSES